MAEAGEGQPLANSAADPLVAHLRRCCLRVMGEKSGCGFFVAPQLLITCSHVVGSKIPVGATLKLSAWGSGVVADGKDGGEGARQQLQGEVLVNEVTDDLALVRLLSGSYPHVALDREVRLGDQLVAIGFPQEGQRLELDQFTAEFEAEVPFENASLQSPTGVELKFKGGQVRHGFSGGPLLNRRTWRVIGVVADTRDARSTMGGFAKPLSCIEAVLKAAGQTRPPLDPDWEVSEGQQRQLAEGVQTCTPQQLLQLRKENADCPNNLNRARTGAVSFLGRRDAMAQLHHQLQQQEGFEISAVLTGMAGVGKTELALQYALQHKKEMTYPGGICWIGVQAETAGVQLLNFAKSLLDLIPPKDLDLRGQLDYCWAKWPRGDVLLIFDDVRHHQEIHDYLPPQEQRFKVLITSRQQWLAASSEQVCLDVLSESAALALLESLIGVSRLQAELEVGKQLCAWLGYLPLGLELVGRFLQEFSGWKLVQMQQKLLDKGLQLPALRDPSAGMTAQKGVEAAFEVSWEELNQAARDLGYFLSLFALAPIPWRLVIDMRLTAEDEDELELIRQKQLLRFHLLQVVAGEVYQLHSLVRTFFKKKLSVSGKSEIIKQIFAEAIATIANDILPEALGKDVDFYFPHLEETEKYFQNYLYPEKLRLLYIGLGRINIYYGYYVKAQHYCQVCLEISRQTFDEYSIEAGDDYNKLGLSLYHTGQYHMAKKYLHKGLEIRERTSRRKSENIAESYNNLGELYLEINDYNGAEHHLETALKIREDIDQLNPSKESKLDISDSYNSLAGLYYSQGKAYDLQNTLLGFRYARSAYKQARSNCEHALKLKIQQLGENHYDVIQNQINLGEIYRKIKNYQAAESIFNIALDKAQILLGENSLKVADIYNNLGVLYAEQNKFEEAIKIIEEAREIFLKRLGDKHPRTEKTAQNLLNICVESQNF